MASFHQNFRWQPATVLALLFFAYLSFLLFGSLVPLNFYLMPMEQAWNEFSRLSFSDLTIGSRSDLLANILLYIPLSYFLIGSLWYRHSRCQWLSVILVFGFCQSVSILVEFLQLFSPPRTTDLRDILANGLGSGLGLLIWCRLGPQINTNFLRWQKLLGMDKNKIAPLYLLLFTLYSLLPFDLTISPVEVYHQFTGGKVILIPFSLKDVWIGRQLQIFSLEASIWAMIGFFWMLSSSFAPRYVWLNGILYVFAIEFLQLFVYSRVTDITDVLGGVLGIGIGVLTARYLQRRIPKPMETRRQATGIAFSIAALWSIVICCQFWFPFNFSFQGDFLSTRWQQANTFPFWMHFYSTEFTSLEDILRTLLIFAPLGAFFAFFARVSVYGKLAYFNGLVVVYFLAFALLIEVGQILRVDAYPDITDVAFAWVSSMIGYFVCLQHSLLKD